MMKFGNYEVEFSDSISSAEFVELVFGGSCADRFGNKVLIYEPGIDEPIYALIPRELDELFGKEKKLAILPNKVLLSLGDELFELERNESLEQVLRKHMEVVYDRG